MWRTRLAGEVLPPLLIVLGPTAIGKTRLALSLAEALKGEIIGADSRQIYRYMDIGTAKPTLAQRERVPHHLVDCIDPSATLTAAEFQDWAYQAIDAVHVRGRLPLLVGGTGQYLTAVAEGWSMPRVPPDPALRAQFETLAAREGVYALHNRLVDVDIEAADRIHPNNVRRVIRALEVYHATGTPISVLQRKQAPPYRLRTLGLMMDREALYLRADQRVDAMMAAGFAEEVKNLLDRGYGRDLPSMSGLGYPELASHWLDGLPLAEAVSRIKTSTHDFIRRQIVWFRGHDRGILWHNVATLQPDAIITATRRWLDDEDN